MYFDRIQYILSTLISQGTCYQYPLLNNKVVNLETFNLNIIE